jgi:hypothetical protein
VTRTLIVKLDSRLPTSASKFSNKIFHLDKISHGLFSHALFNGQLPTKEPLLLRPCYAVVDQILLLPEIEREFLKPVAKLWADAKEVFGMGSIEDREWRTLKEFFPGISEWEDLAD